MGQFEKGNKYAFGSGYRTAEEERELKHQGGINSGKTRSMQSYMREIENERVKEGSSMKKKEDFARKLADLVAKGNLKAMELYLKLMGELDNNVNLTIRNPRDLTPEEAAALHKHLEENY